MAWQISQTLNAVFECCRDPKKWMVCAKFLAARRAHNIGFEKKGGLHIQKLHAHSKSVIFAVPLNFLKGQLKVPGLVCKMVELLPMNNY